MGFREHLKMRLRRGLGLLNIEEQICEIQDTLHKTQTEYSKEYFQSLIDTSKPGTVFNCKINGMDLLVPVEILHLYPHCLHLDEDQKPVYLVETRQSDWLCDKLNPGDIALDIGAAFGVITAALSKKVGNTGRVYAFDPSRTAQTILQHFSTLNNRQNVTVVPKAISERIEHQEFFEYTANNELSWASDASSLVFKDANPTHEGNIKYTVEVTTLDDFVTSLEIEPKAIKMDIEGFELYALQGGKETLKKYAPHLCIDIHQDVKTGESALIGVEPYLQELGYHLEMEGHALYCTPYKS
ncbi:FkbM family methyltransferase [Lusitaniella coriacea]|uniref:FkbM family methyltransferase n=1 Tax=Lusitaniella coriacea TaxID=1983105 RepID=UPI003CF2E456